MRNLILLLWGPVMIDKKYELTDETTIIDKYILYRIKALRDFGDVRAGDLGGYIQSEENLSHENICWVSDNACIYQDAWVRGNARVFGNALVFENAQVFGNALVFGNARVFGNTWVGGDAHVYGDAWVFGNAWIYGDDRVYGNANGNANGNAWIYGDDRVFRNARIYENAKVSGRDWIAWKYLSTLYKKFNSFIKEINCE